MFVFFDGVGDRFESVHECRGHVRLFVQHVAFEADPGYVVIDRERVQVRLTHDDVLVHSRAGRRRGQEKRRRGEKEDGGTGEERVKKSV